MKQFLFILLALSLAFSQTVQQRHLSVIKKRVSGGAPGGPDVWYYSNSQDTPPSSIVPDCWSEYGDTVVVSQAGNVDSVAVFWATAGANEDSICVKVLWDNSGTWTTHATVRLYCDGWDNTKAWRSIVLPSSYAASTNENIMIVWQTWNSQADVGYSAPAGRKRDDEDCDPSTGFLPAGTWADAAVSNGWGVAVYVD